MHCSHARYHRRAARAENPQRSLHSRTGIGWEAAARSQGEFPWRYTPITTATAYTTMTIPMKVSIVCLSPLRTLCTKQFTKATSWSARRSPCHLAPRPPGGIVRDPARGAPGHPGCGPPEAGPGRAAAGALLVVVPPVSVIVVVPMVPRREAAVAVAVQPLYDFGERTAQPLRPRPHRHAGRNLRSVVYLDPETAKRLKVLAAQRGTSMQALGAADLEALIADTNDQMLEC